MKKNRIIQITLLFTLVILLSACRLPYFNIVRGSGDVVAETRAISDFNKVSLDGIGQLIIAQGRTESLEIEAEDNIMDQLKSEVSDDTLILGFEEVSWRKRVIPTENIIYRLTVEDLTEIEINGLGDLDLTTLETTSLKLEIDGAGEIKISNLITDNLEVNINGAARISISGEVTSQSVKINGTGSYGAEDLLSQSTAIEIDGLGDAKVWVIETLDISIDGGGNVDYYGSPIVSQDVNGLGEIQHLGEK